MVNYKINVYLKHTEMENMYVREFIELVTQDVNGNNFEFTVYEDDNVYDLTNKRVTMVVKSDSGTVIQENCQVVDAKQGKATITLPPDMLIENGPYMAEVQIWEGVNSRVTTLPFDYTVRLSLENDESIKADPRFSLLQVALQNVNDADGKSKEALKLSKEAKAICDDLVPKANTASQNAQTALDRAESVVTQEELAQKVMLDGKDTKFDFIKNQVVQDGLVEIQSDLEMRRVNTADTGLYKLYSNEALKDVNYFVVNIEELVEGAIFFIFNSSDVILQVNKNNVGNNAKWLYVEIDKNAKKAKLNSDSGYTKEVNFENYRISFFGNYVGKYGAIGTCSAFMYYSCIISPKEILHNFSVLNNSESIKKLHTTDSTGKTSILKLASDSHHVEMDTGRTLQEEYTSLLGKFGKEIDSPDGSAIQVNDGISGKVLKMSIKGQTVKCLASKPTSTSLNMTGIRQLWFAGKVDLVPAREYKITINAINVVGTCNITILNSEGNNIFPNAFTVKNGENVFLSTSLNVNTNLLYAFLSGSSTSDASCTVNYINIVDGTDKDKVSGNIPFGLSSTQAIISNNGEPYSIYANEEDEMNKKVISLGGVGDVKDTLEILEDGSAIWVQNTKEIVLNGSENITNETSVNKINTLYFMIQTGDDAVKNTTNNNAVSSNFKSVSASMLWNNDEEAVSCDTVPRIRIDRSKLTTQDVAGFKEYLKSNSLTVRYKLATPIITHIPKEIVPTIRTHNQTNILDFGGAVKPSSFKITVPVDRIAEIEARLQALESTTVDVVLNK